MVIQHDLPLDVQQEHANHLLAALPADSLERLRPHLKFIHLPLGKVLYEPGVKTNFAYFPTDSITSLQSTMSDGSSAEIAIVGKEGLLGVSVFMGGQSATYRAVTQSAGGAFSVPGNILKAEFDRHNTLTELLLRYTQALITQMSQLAVCNRYHSIHQQLCRRLLMTVDRLPSNRVLMTQEMMAQMLGVRREGVTEAAGKLQKLGAITYSRGKIEVLDRAKLECLCCECYAVVKTETERLLNPNAMSVNGARLQSRRA